MWGSSAINARLQIPKNGLNISCTKNAEMIVVEVERMSPIDNPTGTIIAKGLGEINHLDASEGRSPSGWRLHCGAHIRYSEHV